MNTQPFPRGMGCPFRSRWRDPCGCQCSEIHELGNSVHSADSSRVAHLIQEGCCTLPSTAVNAGSGKASDLDIEDRILGPDSGEATPPNGPGS